jgi:hypothetical protein
MDTNTGPIRDGIIRVGKAPYTSPKILGGDGEPKKNLKKTVFWRPKQPKNFKKNQKNEVQMVPMVHMVQKHGTNGTKTPQYAKNMQYKGLSGSSSI